MSDSSIALKPVIDEPSKPIPPSNASSSSSLLIEKLFSCPRMSVNQKRMKRMSRSSTIALTSSAVCGWSAMRLPARIGGRRNARSLLAREPVVRPALERAHASARGRGPCRSARTRPGPGRRRSRAARRSPRPRAPSGARTAAGRRCRARARGSPRSAAAHPSGRAGSRRSSACRPARPPGGRAPAAGRSTRDGASAPPPCRPARGMHQSDSACVAGRLTRRPAGAVRPRPSRRAGRRPRA